MRKNGLIMVCLVLAIGLSGLWSQSWGGSCGLLGEYYQDASFGAPVFNNLQYSQIDPVIDFDWGGGAPAGLNNDVYSIKWTGSVHAAVAGSYDFATRSDDSSQVFIDGNLVVDNGGNHANTIRFGTIALTAGWHAIEVTYHEWGGIANVSLLWAPPGAGTYGVIDCANLSPTATPLPSSLLLLAPGLLGLLALRKRQ